LESLSEKTPASSQTFYGNSGIAFPSNVGSQSTGFQFVSSNPPASMFGGEIASNQMDSSPLDSSKSSSGTSFPFVFGQTSNNTAPIFGMSNSVATSVPSSSSSSSSSQMLPPPSGTIGFNGSSLMSTQTPNVFGYSQQFSNPFGQQQPQQLTPMNFGAGPTGMSNFNSPSFGSEINSGSAFSIGSGEPKRKNLRAKRRGNK